MKWFKHDADAFHDAKLRRLRAKYGIQGYGVYFYCLELIARNVEAHNLTFELEHDAELIAQDVGLGRELIEEMMRFMVDQKLFECADGIVTCLKMASRTDEYTAKLIQKKNKNIGQKVPTLSRHSPDTIGTMSDLIEEKRTEQTLLRFARPSGSDVTAYANSIGFDLDGDEFCDHYDAKGWKVGKTPMKDWRAAVRTWKRSRNDSRPTAGGEVVL